MPQYFTVRRPFISHPRIIDEPGKKLFTESSFLQAALLSVAEARSHTQADRYT